MDNKLLSSPVSDSSAEALRTEPQSQPELDALAEVRKVIETDFRIDAKQYLKEIHVAASGE
jgi:hypothetical protein